MDARGHACSPPPVTTPLDRVRTAYDAVARPYAERFLHELDAKPLDRALLCWFSELVRGAGPVADLGCGPGQIARWLHERGTNVSGIDLSPAMVALASDLHRDRGISFRTGDLLALDLGDCSLAGAVAFYAHVHLPPADLPRAFRELPRVLRPGAPALLAFHAGDGEVHLDEFLGERISLDWHLHRTADVVAALEGAGLVVETRLERAPYVPQEHPTVRGYVLARRAG